MKHVVDRRSGEGNTELFIRAFVNVVGLVASKYFFLSDGFDKSYSTPVAA